MGAMNYAGATAHGKRAKVVDLQEVDNTEQLDRIQNIALGAMGKRGVKRVARTERSLYVETKTRVTRFMIKGKREIICNNGPARPHTTCYHQSPNNSISPEI